MKIKPSIIISFLTGHLYSDLPPTILFSEMLEQLIGYSPMIHELPFIRQACKNQINDQLPTQLREVYNTWCHTDDWRKRLEEIDNDFEGIQFTKLD